MSERLDRLVAEIRACRVCRDCPEGAVLPVEPRPVVRVARSARILIVGQAPGVRVHASGLPFDDPSGDRLRDWLGVDRDLFYDTAAFAFAPMGFCFPGLDEKGSDLPPRRECAPRWQRPLAAALPSVRLVVLVGLYAQRFHLGEEAGKTLTETVRDARRIASLPGRCPRLPLPHPSWRNNVWLRKNRWFEHEVIPLLRAAVTKALNKI